MAQISSIVYQPEDQPYPEGHFEDFIRVSVKTAVLIPNHGIQGDRKAGRNPNRQINLLSQAWLATKQTQGYSTQAGEFGEQLIVEGLNFETIRKGDHLKIGTDVILEITMPRLGCIRLEATQDKKGLTGKEIGLLAKVITGGTIQINDTVAIR